MLRKTKILTLTAVTLLLLTACQPAAPPVTPRVSPTPFPGSSSGVVGGDGSDTYYVLYRVTGNGRRADVTYENAGGNSEQIDGVEIEWKKGQTMEVGDFVYLSAQSADDTGRTITCEILVNGEVVETATSSGRYVIASCSGRVGDD